MADILVGYFTAAKQPVNQIQIASHGLLNGDTVRFTLGRRGTRCLRHWWWARGITWLARLRHVSGRRNRWWRLPLS